MLDWQREMCKAQHKLVREVINNRVSVINKDGTLGWRTCEGTILVCPAVKGSGTVCGDTLSDEQQLSTNKRVQISCDAREPIRTENQDGAIEKVD